MPNVEFSVSCTTRPQRPGEIEAKNYFFKSKTEFESMIARGELLEWAEFVGNYYGTPKKFVEEKLSQGKDVFLEIEVQGALQVMQKCPQAVSIFLAPPRFSDLEERLRKRGTETEAVMMERLKKAKEEMGFMGRFTYVVTNDDVDEAVETIRALILQERFNFDLDLAPSSETSAK